MDQTSDIRIGRTFIIRAFHESELQLRIADKQKTGYELVNQGCEREQLAGSRWWAKLKYVGLPQ